MESKIMNLKMVTPDDKGRVTLGHLADGVSRFAVIDDLVKNGYWITKKH